MKINGVLADKYPINFSNCVQVCESKTLKTRKL